MFVLFRDGSLHSGRVISAPSSSFISGRTICGSLPATADHASTRVANYIPPSWDASRAPLPRPRQGSSIFQLFGPRTRYTVFVLTDSAEALVCSHYCFAFVRWVHWSWKSAHSQQRL